MKLQYRFILFIFLIVVLFVLLSAQLLPEHKWLFLVSELVIVLIIVVSVHLYRIFILPVNLISAGVESIKDRDFNTTFLKVGQREIDDLIDIYNEMIRRIRNERLSREEQQYFLEKLIEASPAGIIILDFENRIQTINPAAVKAFVCSDTDLIGKSLDRIDNSLAAQLAMLKSGDSKIISLNGLQKYKCQKAHFIDRGFSHHFIIIEELSDDIIRAEKNAYGKVVRMMSHEVNNSIGAINSILNTVLQFKTQLSAEDRADYEEALTVAIERNNNLNNFMSNYADIIRLPKPNRETVDLKNLLDRLKVLTGADLRQRNIRWLDEYSKRSFTIQADIEQLELVLLNIIKNAAEAIENDGEITVITASDPEKRLIIRDTGPGLSPETAENLFTPFFSTKKDGQGIGLTLAREILVNHGFRFSLKTVRQNCTEFTFIFP